MTYGTPRQYLVLRIVRDKLLLSERHQREIENELVDLGWLSESTPAPGLRSYSVTAAGLEAITAYESNPRWSGVEEEKRLADKAPRLVVDLDIRSASTTLRL